jgi:hypothetical protein
MAYSHLHPWEEIIDPVTGSKHSTGVPLLNLLQRMQLHILRRKLVCGTCRFKIPCYTIPTPFNLLLQRTQNRNCIAVCTKKQIIMIIAAHAAKISIICITQRLMLNV